jgi:hypothetical protein
MVKEGLPEVYRGPAADGLDLDAYWKAETKAKERPSSTCGLWMINMFHQGNGGRITNSFEFKMRRGSLLTPKISIEKFIKSDSALTALIKPQEDK